MKDGLVRFGVAMEPGLVEELDALAEARNCNRSELLRDLARAEASRARVEARSPAVATVTLVYNHHVRELTEKLNSLQHQLGETVRSTMHVHLDHDNCLEVIVMRGRSDRIQKVAQRMIATRGVIHGGAECVAEKTLSLRGKPHGHSHAGSTGGVATHSHEPIVRHRGRPKKKPKKVRT